MRAHLAACLAGLAAAASVSGRYDYGWGDGVIPEEYARLRTLPEVPMGFISAQRQSDALDVFAPEACDFLGTYCALRALNSRPDTPYRYRLDILDMHGSVAEAMAGVVAFETAGIPLVISPPVPTEEALTTVAASNMSQLKLDPAPKAIQVASGTSRMPRIDNFLLWGPIWRTTPSFCTEIKALLSVVRAMQWKMFSVIHTLDWYGQAWPTCYDSAVADVWPDENDRPSEVCLSPLPLYATGDPQTPQEIRKNIRSIVTSGKESSLQYVGIPDALSCIAESPSRVLILWTNILAAKQVLQAIAEQPALADVQLVGSGRWASFQNTASFWRTRKPPTQYPFVQGLIYTMPKFPAKDDVQKCMDTITAAEHPLIRDSWESAFQCRIPRSGRSYDTAPTFPAYATWPMCTLQEPFRDVMVWPEAGAAQELIIAMDATARKSGGTIDADALNASGYFKDEEPREFSFDIKQCVGPSLDVRSVGTFQTNVLSIDYSQLSFAGGRQWVPAYVVSGVSDKTRIGLNIAVASVLLGSLFCHIILFIGRKRPVVRKTSPQLAQLILLGIDLVLIAQIPWNFTPGSVSQCVLKLWVFLAGVGLVLGCIFARLYRLHVIFNKPVQSLVRGRQSVSNSAIIVRIAIPAMLGDVIIAAFYTTLPGGPPKPYIQIYDETAEAVWECRASTCWPCETSVIGGCIAYNALLLGAVLYFAYRTRNVASAYNEAKQLAIVGYMYLLCGILIMPLYYSIYFVWQPVEEGAAACLARYRVLGIGLCAAATIAVLFLPRCVRVIYHFYVRTRMRGARKEAREASSQRIIDYPAPHPTSYAAVAMMQETA